ncbi:hypothetical protein EDB81DRAFT_229376 [Dactylonectria macrodidyma]|uniref:Extracellular serine-rich protein n=1 Tax=Dactylonectria macrodidyma TaxID=307937 RepID=A0A9P9DLM6_9HYPO|nr:hypothetical protein EDB81DRAFT_229376 [Dactylonectria macrodidyma]
MHYLSIAVAALGLLRVGQANLCKSDGLDGPPSVPAVINAVDHPIDVDRRDASHSTVWIDEDNYEDIEIPEEASCQIEAEGSNAVQKRQLWRRRKTAASVNTTIRRLTPRIAHTVKFSYSVYSAAPANTCRLQAAFNGNVFARTSRFTRINRGRTWVDISGTVTPYSRTGKLKISVICQARGSARVFVDDISVFANEDVSTSTNLVLTTSSLIVATETADVTSTQPNIESSTTSVSVSSASTAAVSSSVVSGSDVASNSDAALSSVVVSSPDVASSSTAASSSADDSSSASASNSASVSVSAAASSSAAGSSTDTASSSSAVSTSDDASSSISVSSSATESVSAAGSSSASSSGEASSSVVSSSDAVSSTAAASSSATDSASASVSAAGSISADVSSSATDSVSASASASVSASVSVSASNSAAASTSATDSVSAAGSSSAAAASSSDVASSSAAVSSSATASASASASVSAAASSSATSSSTSASPNSLPSGSVDSTILIIARDETTAAIGSSGLLGYGIPYTYLIVPQDGTTLPKLNSTVNTGNFGGIIVLDSVSYDYGATGWRSALTDAQWAEIHAYQTAFSVRMVRINDYPGISSGTLPVAGGCCEAGVSQSVFFSDTSAFSTANIKADAEVPTTGLYHVPASITDSSTTKAVAKFGTATGFSSESVAAVINNFNGREQFVWFMSWAPSWSLTSAYLEHGHIHWMTRGLFLGKRKIHLGAQIDDVQLSTEPYYPPGLGEMRINIADLQAHIDWQNQLAERLPAGSEFWLELAHNGNGDIMVATISQEDEDEGICIPEEAVYYETPVEAPHQWVKPIGSGVDVWPEDFEEYSWELQCAALDEFADWFTVPANRDNFGHISHTFTHLNLNNATYKDTAREIQFNQAWMAQIGIDQGRWYSPNGIVPPQITGLFNGDAIRAWMDNNITYVVGDNTRPATRHASNPYHALITTSSANGHDGLVVIPRFSTRIYYNCHSPECDLEEWIVTSAGTGDFYNLLSVERESVVRNLLTLMSDPYMFHQLNMYTRHDEPLTIGDQSGQLSLVMAWTETVVQEFVRLTNWPIRSITQDDLAHYFLDRETVDKCNPQLSYAFSDDGQSIKSVTVTADGNTCGKPIPVTIPSGSASASGGSSTSDVVGSEPPIQWVTLNGSPVTLTLSEAIAI